MATKKKAAPAAEQPASPPPAPAEDKANPWAIYEAEYEGKTGIELAKAMHEVGKALEERTERLKVTQARYDYLRLKAIPNKFEEEGIENLKIEGVGRVSLTGDMHVQLLAGDREAVYGYFRDIGKGSLITETINPSTLKATIKAMTASGELIPEQIKVSPFTRASITKA